VTARESEKRRKRIDRKGCKESMKKAENDGIIREEKMGQKGRK